MSSRIGFDNNTAVTYKLKLTTCTLIRYTSLAVSSRGGDGQVAPRHDNVQTASLRSLFRAVDVGTSTVHGYSIPITLF